MAFELEIAGQNKEIKFNYGLVFKINREFATKDEKTGEAQGNGAGLLFTQILEKDDDALFKLLQIVCKGKDKLDEKKYFEAIEKYAENFDDEEEAMNSLFKELKDEMVLSGFFKQKVRKFVETMDKAIKKLESKEEEKEQAEMMKETAELIKKEIS
ncbi:tail assembly chaperone [Listeria kieliensis]